MTGFEFRFQYEEGKPEIIVRVGPDSDIDALAEAFCSFLKACGYASDLEIEIKRSEDEAMEEKGG